MCWLCMVKMLLYLQFELRLIDTSSSVFPQKWKLPVVHFAASVELKRSMLATGKEVTDKELNMFCPLSSLLQRSAGAV